jgi:predicted nucleic acid-binding Zn ribbon protein
MPIYRYRCPFCQHEQDEYRTIAERHNGPRCHGDMEIKIMPAMVAVFHTYQTVAHDKETGKPMQIGSKAEHEAFLRRNGYEEVGNDKSMAPPHPEEVAESKQKWNDAPDAPMVNVEKLKNEGWIQEDLTV